MRASLLRYLGQVVPTFGITVILWLVAIIPINMVEHRHDSDRLRDAQLEQSFWQLVDSPGPVASDGSVVTLLARDLQPLVDNPDAVALFRAPANRYGGIDDAVGFRPFDNRGLDCRECGPLSKHSRLTLGSIACCGYDPAPLPAVNDDHWRLTPGGWPVWITVIMWFSLYGAVQFVWRWIADPKFRALPWDRPSIDRTGWAVAAWPAAVPVIAWRRIRRRSAERRIAEQFPAQMALVAQADHLLDKHRDDPDAMRIGELRDQLVTELRTQARAKDTRGDEMAAIASNLRNGVEFMQLRRDALQEVDR
jgi:hypothetical protein